MCNLKGVYTSNIGVKQNFYNRLSSKNDNVINIICDCRGICLKPCVTKTSSAFLCARTGDGLGPFTFIV